MMQHFRFEQNTASASAFFMTAGFAACATLLLPNAARAVFGLFVLAVLLVLGLSIILGSSSPSKAYEAR